MPNKYCKLEKQSLLNSNLKHLIKKNLYVGPHQSNFFFKTLYLKFEFIYGLDMTNVMRLMFQGLDLTTVASLMFIEHPLIF